MEENYNNEPSFDKEIEAETKSASFADEANATGERVVDDAKSVYINESLATDTMSTPKKVKKDKKEKKKSGKGTGGRLVAACIIGLAFGVFAAGGFYGTKQFIDTKKDNGVTASQIETIQKQIDDINNKMKTGSSYVAKDVSTAVTSDVTGVVDKVMPSMVCVTNAAESIYYFWGRSYTKEDVSNGSGIIVGENDTEYLIATNNHVIEEAKTISVQFVDDSVAEAYVKGYDASLDIAVIGVRKENVEDSTKAIVTVAELGDSDLLKIGEPAIAIGNALGYGQSVTTGVISALKREISTNKGTESSDLIQTSAAINPGNSGGALLNIYGQVIGINSAKISSSTVEGMGFAIPISAVKDIIVDFSNREIRNKVADEERGYLGITCRDSSELNLSLLGYPDGVYVENVYEGSPAEAAMIYPGDLITKIDGQSISTYTQLQERLSYYSHDEEVKITFQRRENGAFVEKEVIVILGDRAAIKD